MNEKENREILSYTLVLHHSLKSLQITLNEYCVADSIYHLANNPSSPIPGWCYASKEYIASLFGLSRRSVSSLITNLEQSNLVERNPVDSRYVRTTTRWYNEVILKKLDRAKQKDLDVQISADTEKNLPTPGSNFPPTEKNLLTPQEESSHYNNSNSNNNNESIYSQIFDCWNEQGIVKHRALTDKVKRKINGLVKEKITPEEICQSIVNYGKILNGSEYFWSHKWTLEDFLARGVKKFMSWDIASSNYLSNKGGFNNKNEKFEQQDYRGGKYGNRIK